MADVEDTAIKPYLADSPPAVVQLAIKPHWDALSDKEKLYAHHISRAAHLGTRVILRTISPESLPIYNLILALYTHCHGDWMSFQRQSAISETELRYFLEYATQFLANCGNYRGFGDSKFVPRLTPERFEALVEGVPEAKGIFESIGGRQSQIFADLKRPEGLHLGFPGKGHVSEYYPESKGITEKEIEYINEFLSKKNLLPENTRLRKLEDGNFQILVASGVDNPPKESTDTNGVKSFDLGGILDGKRVDVVYGDFREEMAKIAHEMKLAGQYAANETQKIMMDKYAESFATGSIAAFKDSQRAWVKDIKPMVESNIGFIETYRDPAGVRGEWEGFVAMVNKDRTLAFGRLVAAAPAMIPKLPWPPSFEVDSFKPPDFTSLEVLSFCSTGIPAGINIPNYEDVRREVGFKNVSLGNVLSAKAPNEKVPFVAEGDLELYKKLTNEAFEVQVGIHELLGHGTGKLLAEKADGSYNFDVKNPPVSPVTGKPVTTWYKPGQTWPSVFGSISSSMEECRAECVAMVLGCEWSILELFGHGDGKEDIDGSAGDVLWAMYILMARAGVVALEFWDPNSRKWGQAHMQARFSILQVFLQVGEGFCTIKANEDDLSDLTINIDRSKILTVGRPAVEKYLQKLHVYKSTADVEEGRKLYDSTTNVDKFWGEKVRPVVMANKQPRKVFVQCNTVLEGDKVVLREYEPTLEGMIKSFAERDV